MSVVLRFVGPEHYGILSTPVESIDRYLNYVKDLRHIRDTRGFDKAADGDQALWTLQLGVLAAVHGHALNHREVEELIACARGIADLAEQKRRK